MLEVHHITLCVSGDRSPAGSPQGPTPRQRGTPVVEIGRFLGCTNKLRRKATPNRTLAIYLRTATAPHRQEASPAKMTNAHVGVCDVVGCAKRQSVVGSEKRLTTCFRVYGVASDRHEEAAKTLKLFSSRIKTFSCSAQHWLHRL